MSTAEVLARVRAKIWIDLRERVSEFCVSEEEHGSVAELFESHTSHSFARKTLLVDFPRRV